MLLITLVFGATAVGILDDHVAEMEPTLRAEQLEAWEGIGDRVFDATGPERAAMAEGKAAEFRGNCWGYPPAMKYLIYKGALERGVSDVMGACATNYYGTASDGKRSCESADLDRGIPSVAVSKEFMAEWGFGALLYVEGDGLRAIRDRGGAIDDENHNRKPTGRGGCWIGREWGGPLSEPFLIAFRITVELDLWYPARRDAMQGGHHPHQCVVLAKGCSRPEYREYLRARKRG